MRIPSPAPRPRAESIVPMINVVFLLLIFFLMTAQISPPAPFEVAPPAASGEAPEASGAALHVSAEGERGYRDLTGDAAVAAALADRAPGAPLALRADARLPAQDLAALLRELAAAGADAVEIAAIPGGAGPQERGAE